ncbi:hypothetical protein ACMHYO_11615 [Allopusillimonas ginsengisoli]|uniref:hypothetical protein n=1 Tax=Allopusillimonas ginsengisoli TaxID=453575 RepID=UPI0039C3F036
MMATKYTYHPNVTFPGNGWIEPIMDEESPLIEETVALEICDLLNEAARHREEAEQPSLLLAADHEGMRVDYSGLFEQASDALARGAKEPALAEMLRQFEAHLTELGRRWYAGDAAVVDELLQLYCVEDQAREAIKNSGSLSGTFSAEYSATPGTRGDVQARADTSNGGNYGCAS